MKQNIKGESNFEMPCVAAAGAVIKVRSMMPNAALGRQPAKSDPEPIIRSSLRADGIQIAPGYGWDFLWVTREFEST
jgi:hypothetical protein